MPKSISGQRRKERKLFALANLGNRREQPIYFANLLDRLCSYFFQRCGHDHKDLGWGSRMTPYKLSRRIGATPQAVTRTLVEQCKIPSFTMADRILRGLDIDLRHLLSNMEGRRAVELERQDRLPEIARAIETIQNQLTALLGTVDRNTKEPVTHRMHVRIGTILAKLAVLRALVGLEEE